MLVVFFNITFSNDDYDDNSTYQLKVHIGIIQIIFYYIATLRSLSVFIWRNNLAVYLCFFCPYLS